ncbi:UNVERIFIED_CONTAM: hypothetical protein RMT77_015221 [Armadillidium vulgare]
MNIKSENDIKIEEFDLEYDFYNYDSQAHYIDIGEEESLKMESNSSINFQTSTTQEQNIKKEHQEKNRKMKVRPFCSTRYRTRMQRSGDFPEEISAYVYKECPNNPNSDDDDTEEFDHIQMEVMEEDFDDVDYCVADEEINSLHPSDADAEADVSASVNSNVQENISSGETFRWRKRKPKMSSHEFLGSQFSLPEKVLTPLEYFKYFFSDKLMSHIAEQTNIYCIQEKVKKNLNCSLIDTDQNEIEQFLGILLFMGIYPLPQYRMYWNPKFYLPQITEALKGGVNRFESIMRFIHFNDNSKIPDTNTSSYDKLYKLRPILDSVLEKCKTIEPEEYHSIGEQIIPTKAKSILKQYDPKKLHKWGYKVFSRCGSSGMLYEFEVYTGKNDNKSTVFNLGEIGDLVVRLCDNLPKHKNYKVFFDNLFTTLPLMKKLHAMGIPSLGTIRSNRMGGAEKLLNSERELKTMGKGSYDWRVDSSSAVTLIRWYDNSIVQLASTFVGKSLGKKVQRWCPKSKSKIEINCPQMVEEYNKFMGGVDLNGMLLALYRIKLRSNNKWYMPIFFYLLKVAVTNAWLLYRRQYDQLFPGDKKFMSLLDFQIEIAYGLTMAGKMPHQLVKQRGRPSLSEPENKRSKTSASVALPSKDVRLDGFGHFPSYDKKQHRCRHCTNGRTHLMCLKCQIFLCLNKDRNCFLIFHTKGN